jgi:hypothetical protein
MAHVVLVYTASPLRVDDDRVYVAQACGRERDDGTWEGWLEFVPADDTTVLRSQRETTQPNLAALEYWATGITPVYLVGALERTLTAPAAPAAGAARPVPSVYDAPAPVELPATDDGVTAKPVLNPFSAYTKGEEMLRRQLAALSPRHLRAIVVGYALADPSEIELDALTGPELVELITAAVRARLAA